VITSAVVPLPPVNVPMMVPPKVTFAAETPIWPAPVPWLRISSRSSAWPPAEMLTVSVPVAKFAESRSATVAVDVIGVAAAFSAYASAAPSIAAITGASLVAATVVTRVTAALVAPSPSLSRNRTVRAVVVGLSEMLR
jgi:hypothetical protein